ncbi:hypothetical protein, variant [Cryptococcus amylolentus CBS 6039]|uniref:Uncharacterized protein n=2 Tax=Cryptococcus amylolentus TaxID=104669 RepID=A0A1E3HHD7_9TREE|nr:hypothetical protein L202_05757 [Cryptococcus amylolentus CBS 6039]XP_018991276.1 hypothetical protein, variant [Cryptococcus amylolentus CBS 6039]ODN75744.1 hypothetical protein L202_05757 [Cryptococcus amylolentus CBS 6039]ODN75745.1 hypothetical protein, variant [Cryptococcus amylolentus CBS 6039]ODN96920.1 hypothetical protein I350_07893 [Cryptococcus amylolentus CBS 6273]
MARITRPLISLSPLDPDTRLFLFETYVDSLAVPSSAFCDVLLLSRDIHDKYLPRLYSSILLGAERSREFCIALATALKKPFVLYNEIYPSPSWYEDQRVLYPFDARPTRRKPFTLVRKLTIDHTVGLEKLEYLQHSVRDHVAANKKLTMLGASIRLFPNLRWLVFLQGASEIPPGRPEKTFQQLLRYKLFSSSLAPSHICLTTPNTDESDWIISALSVCMLQGSHVYDTLCLHGYRGYRMRTMGVNRMENLRIWMDEPWDESDRRRMAEEHAEEILSLMACLVDSAQESDWPLPLPLKTIEIYGSFASQSTVERMIRASFSSEPAWLRNLEVHGYGEVEAVCEGCGMGARSRWDELPTKQREQIDS